MGLGTTVVTDGSNSYTGLQGTFQHKIVQHTKDEWVIGKHHTNTVEGFFSHLKRMVKGTHIKISKGHAKKYVDECVFRYIHRKQGQEMFFTILGKIA